MAVVAGTDVGYLRQILAGSGRHLIVVSCGRTSLFGNIQMCRFLFFILGYGLVLKWLTLKSNTVHCLVNKLSIVPAITL